MERTEDCFLHSTLTIQMVHLRVSNEEKVLIQVVHFNMHNDAHLGSGNVCPLARILQWTLLANAEICVERSINQNHTQHGSGVCVATRK